MADLFKDEKLLKLSRGIAARIATRDRMLKSEAHRSLRDLLIKKYSGKFFLGITG